MAKHGKSYNAAAEKIDRATLYTPLQAAKLIKELDTAKFDETVEAHFRLGIDTRKADQNIRGSISLPHGTGKTVRVAVFAEGDDETARSLCVMASPRARRPVRLRLPAPTSSVPTSSSPRFRRARSTSTPLSLRRT